MEEKRNNQRHPITVMLKVLHPSIGEIMVKTKNLSDSGLFILAEPKKMPNIGEIVQCQVQRDNEDLPMIPMQIIRTTEDGLGLKIIDKK